MIENKKSPPGSGPLDQDHKDGLFIQNVGHSGVIVVRSGQRVNGPAAVAYQMQFPFLDERPGQRPIGRAASANQVITIHFSLPRSS